MAASLHADGLIQTSFGRQGLELGFGLAVKKKYLVFVYQTSFCASLTNDATLVHCNIHHAELGL